MPDFRVADTAPEHPKLRAAGLAAVGLWAAAGAYAMRELTDGWVPEYWVLTWPSGKRAATALVTIGLWDRETRTGIAGYVFHDWTDYQRPAAQITDEKARARERAARSRRASAGNVRRTDSERAPNVRDSLSLSLSLSPGGSVGGVATDSDANARNAAAASPPALASVDPTNPRCREHRDIPATERGPGCHACRAVREQVERAVGDPGDVERQARLAWRAAVDACPDCDENGKQELPDGSLRRHHEFAEAAS